jgi:luciferase family oxidoreductase group 1
VSINPLKISVLDQSPISEGMTGSEALHNTIDLARLTDELGYHRYWVAEHHGGPMLAGPSPEALIGPIASATTRLRVGSGGVMLPHYSPFKVAETFSLLSGLYPGRIDLGIGRASGTDPLTTFALQRDRSKAMPDDFPNQLAELLAHLEDRLPEDHPFVRLPKSLPGRPETPEVYLLGSSPQSGIWAAELGLPYVFADFINPKGAPIVAAYRRDFEDVRLAAPKSMVCVWALAADDEDEAKRLAASSKMAFIMLREGRLIAVPPPDKALRFLEQRPPGLQQAHRRRNIVGNPEQVKAGIEEAAAEYGAEEVIVVTITYDHEARRRSYELIAEQFGLTPATDHADVISAG